MSDRRSQDLMLAAPAALFLLLFMVVPLLLMAYVSVLERSPLGGVVWGSHTGVAYEKLFLERDLLGRISLNGDYAAIFARSALLAAVTAGLTFVIALPTALYMTTMQQRSATLLLFLVTLPFWTNLLVRNFAWILILRNGGQFDRALQWLGITSKPLDVLYTPWATGIGLTYSFLPFMILPIYVALQRIDKRLVEAAFDLGADRLRVLTRIVLPLAMPGILTGIILVFVPCLGAYVSPELLGGGKSLMIGSLVQAQFGASRNWPFGAALGLVLVVVLMTALVVLARLDRKAERST